MRSLLMACNHDVAIQSRRQVAYDGRLDVYSLGHARILSRTANAFSAFIRRWISSAGAAKNLWEGCDDLGRFLGGTGFQPVQIKKHRLEAGATQKHST